MMENSKIVDIVASAAIAKKMGGGGGGGYPEPTGEIVITENGAANVKDYAVAIVDVPQPDGKVDLTENGIYDVTEYTVAEVNVQASGMTLDDLVGMVDLGDVSLPTATEIIAGALRDRRASSISAPVLTTIGENGLRNTASWMEEISLPECTTLGDYALCLYDYTHGSNPSRLTKVDLPNITSIGQYALSGHRLREVHMPKLERFAVSCMYNAWDPSIDKIVFESVSQAGGNNALYGFPGTRVYLPMCSANIASVVACCPNLQVLDSGNIASIARSYYTSAKSLKVLALRIMRGATLSVTGSSTFPASLMSGDPGTALLVPRALISTWYETATNWSSLIAAGMRVRALEDYTVDGTTTGLLDDVKIDVLLAETE